MPNIGPLELIVVLAIALILLGPKRLPDAGRSLGRGLREFNDSVTGRDHDEPARPFEAHAGGERRDVLSGARSSRFATARAGRRAPCRA